VRFIKKQEKVDMQRRGKRQIALQNMALLFHIIIIIIIIIEAQLGGGDKWKES
jgi:hypothetical protein